MRKEVFDKGHPLYVISHKFQAILIAGLCNQLDFIDSHIDSLDNCGDDHKFGLHNQLSTGSSWKPKIEGKFNKERF